MMEYGTNKKLDALVDSSNWLDRLEAAKQGYGLDKLINDEHWAIRKYVARHSYGLDILIDDTEWQVRMAVGKRGYGIKQLINDENEYVRQACYESAAWPDYLVDHWEELLFHKDWGVRRAIARQGFALNILIHDEDFHVRDEVERQLGK